LASLGFGLGSLVDDGARGGVGGVSYAVYVAPGVLAATAMQVAIGESTYPVLGALIWNRQYHAMLATPLRILDILIGHLTYIAIRLLLATTTFAVVGGALGAFRSAWVVSAVPIAVLCGLAHAAPVMAFSVRQENDHGFPVIFRLLMVPMFLFAGTFFPVDQLPAGLRPLAWLTPLWHATDLIRSLLLGDAHALPVAGHLAYLLLWAGAGGVVALHHYRRRLAG
jgi:lipooligosaccharide transport system permease protein